jgi:NitT/TauT family transport system permease protein
MTDAMAVNPPRTDPTSKDGDVPRLADIDGELGSEAHHDAIRRQLQAVVDRQRHRAMVVRNVGRLAIVVLLIAAWAVTSDRWVDSFWVSSPGAVWDRLWEWTVDGTIQHHLTYTLQAMVFGLLLGTAAGIVAGFILGSNRTLSDVFEPFVLVIYSIPKVAIAPLFILWFGIGLGSKIFISAIIVFFLVFYNTFTGVRAVDHEMADAVRIMGATRRQLVVNVILPSSAAWIYTGVSMAVPYSLIGAIVGELIASNRGLGYLLKQSSGTFDTAGTFAALFVLAAMGAIVNSAVRWQQSRSSGWMRVQGSTGSAM